MNNAIAWCFVLAVLGGCAAHVYQNTHPTGHLWTHPPQPRWAQPGAY